MKILLLWLFLLPGIVSAQLRIIHSKPISENGESFLSKRHIPIILNSKIFIIPAYREGSKNIGLIRKINPETMQGQSIKIMSSNNILFGCNTRISDKDLYVASSFNGVVTYMGNILLSAPTGQDVEQPFFGKVDTAGKVYWLKRGFATNGFISTIATDKQKNIYVGGGFKDSLRFDQLKIQTPDSISKFFAKFDSLGNAQWLYPIRGTFTRVDIRTMNVDKAKNILFTGFYDSTTKINDYQMPPTKQGGLCAFIAKYSPAGTRLWIKTLNASKGSGISDLIISESNHYYLAGAAQGKCTFINLPEKETGNSRNPFLLKVNANGNAQWVKTGKPSFPDESFINNHAASNLIFNEPKDKIYVSGFYNGKLQIEETALDSTDYFGGFITSYDTSGNFQNWIQAVGGPESNVVPGEPFFFKNKLYFLSQVIAQNLVTACNPPFSTSPQFATKLIITKLDSCYLTARPGQVKGISCTGAQDGSLQPVVSGGHGSVSYNWGGGISSPNRSNLPPGNYRLIVSDQACCQDTVSYTLAPIIIPKPLALGKDTVMLQEQVWYKSPVLPGISKTWSLSVGGSFASNPNSDSVLVGWGNAEGTFPLGLRYFTTGTCFKDSTFQITIKITGKAALQSGPTPYLFPNPGKDMLSVSGASSGTLHLYDLQGKTILQSKLDEQNTFSTKAFPKGLYFWEVVSGRNKHQGKWVKE